MKPFGCFVVGFLNLMTGLIIGAFLVHFVNGVYGFNALIDYKSPSIEEAVAKCEKNLSRNLNCIGVYTATVKKNE